MKAYRIKSKARFTTFICTLAIMIFIAGGIFCMNAAADMNKDYDNSDYNYVEIQANDTLWNIAAEHNENNYDIRKIVHDICEVNDISTGDIYPGQLLKIPLY